MVSFHVQASSSGMKLLLRFHSVESGQGIEAHNWIDPELYSSFDDLRVRAAWKDNGEVGWKQNFKKDLKIKKVMKAMKAMRSMRAGARTMCAPALALVNS